MEAPYRKFEREAITAIAQSGGTVLDAGGGARFTKWMQKYQSLFDGVRYLTLDSDASTKPDLIGDITKIPLPDASVDAIICASVLEHVQDPIRAAEELSRVLRPGGRLFLYVPSLYPYHAREGHYGDYWRFFRGTVEQLVAGYTEVSVIQTGGIFRAFSFFIPFQHRLRGVLDPLADLLDAVTGANRRTATSGYMVHAVK